MIENKEIPLYNYINNFGDELSPYIVEKLSGCRTYFLKPFSFKKFFVDIIRYCKYIRNKNIRKRILAYSLRKKVLLAVGSIIAEATDNCIVWGAGISSIDVMVNKKCEIRAVRGPLTIERLKVLDINTSNIAVGDPALLMPLLYKAVSVKKYKCGIIPHNVDFEYINGLYKDCENVLIISLRTKNVEKVIDEINSCGYIFSSSLHGLIVAHAYQIPAIQIEVKHNQIGGDGSKFLDYFYSVGIPPYSPLNVDYVQLDKLPNCTKEKLLPSRNKVKVMQAELLKSFPYCLCGDFEQLI